MKLSAFNPLILTENAADTLALFEELGFEQKHLKSGFDETNTVSHVLENPDGFHIDIVEVASMPRDLSAIRLTVDNFDEAYDFLISRGFKNIQGDKATDTGSSKATLLFSPSGFAVSLAEHYKR